MAAISDYLEGQLLNHIFRSTSFSKPTNISVALTNGVIKDSDTGATIDEIPTGTALGLPTGYTRISLGSPAVSGDTYWSSVGEDTVTAFSVFLNPNEQVVATNVDTAVTNTTTATSGYFYPLYTSQTIAESVDTNTPGKAFKFVFDKYPSVELYAPLATVQSGIQTDPGYTLYEGNGFIKNAQNLTFARADVDWGVVSGVAIVDSSTFGGGNVLMHSQLSAPRTVRASDQVTFNTRSLEISLS
ncbi:MAG: hypothetical protein CBC91_06945 [Rickettsiales bacterium TMED131]|nr:MAG: hypothetical protein CBC91_06945 [Rickettsiales bacterium TMED131]